nr:hypothetical protein [Nitrospirota bacterium]
MPDLQFVLMVIALCTSDLPSLNVPEPTRDRIFDRCWALVNDGPPPARRDDRVLDLRAGTNVTLDAMVATIRDLLGEAGIARLTWDHPPSEPSRPSPPEARPLIERLQRLYPEPPDVTNRGGQA